VLRDTSSFIDLETGSLKPFDENFVSNQVGASTLAFSDDGHLMIVGQNDKNLQSVSWLAPSGSGSLDWEDVSASGASDLLSLIKYGARRELSEECSLHDHDGAEWSISSRIMVTGFARMLHRAGKPEFYCLARVAAPENEIRRRKPERYVDRVFAADGKRANLRTGRPSAEISRVCNAYLASKRQIPLSYPLEHGLQLLIEACANERAAAVIDSFMQEDS
jgi:hypothetical protein